MTDVRIPRFPRVSLFDDPDGEIKLAAFRARAFGNGERPDDGSSVYFGPPVARTPVPPPLPDTPAPDEPYLDYSAAFPRPNPEPLPEPRFADMPSEGSLGPALPRPKPQPAGMAEKRAQNAERVAENLLEVPGAIGRGAIGSVEGLGRALDTVLWEPTRMISRWINENVGSTKVPIPDALNTPTFRSALRSLSEPARVVAENSEAAKNLIAERQTALGVVTEHVTTALLSRGMVGTVSRQAGMPATVWANLVQDMAAVALGPTPHAPNVANLFDKYADYPVARPLQEFMRADPSDSDATARLKAALVTGGLVGHPVEAILLWAASSKASLLARAAAAATTGTIEYAAPRPAEPGGAPAGPHP